MARQKRWYPTTNLGKATALGYALVPPALIGSSWLGYFPELLRTPLIATMGAILAFALLAKTMGRKLFMSRSGGSSMDIGFTIVEFIMFISVIGMLAAILAPWVICQGPSCMAQALY